MISSNSLLPCFFAETNRCKPATHSTCPYDPCAPCHAITPSNIRLPNLALDSGPQITLIPPSMLEPKLPSPPNAPPIWGRSACALGVLQHSSIQS